VSTDQPAGYGGEGAAPAPFDLFLASLATCAGFYAVQFCRKRQIATDGLAVALETSRDPETHLLSEVRIEMTLPEGFPAKYRAAIERAVDQCAVKRVIDVPPRMATVVRAAEPEPVPA
jgi:ribosomal protein S12 methylthiotransferase accessory factor